MIAGLTRYAPHLVATGPFALDLNTRFAEATDAVCKRPELASQLDDLQKPPDLRAEIAAQREMLLANVSTQVERTRAIGQRLTELLLEQLALDPAAEEQLAGLVEAERGLQSLIEQEPFLLASLDLTTSHRQSVESWLGGSRSRRPPQLPKTSTEVAVAARHRSVPFENEQVECRRVIAQIQELESDVQKRAIPDAETRLEFRALVTEWESQDRAIIQQLEGVMASVALTALNTALEEDVSPLMRVSSFAGLRQSVTSDQVVLTECYQQLDSMMRDRDDGSFGIAGPRGVGKSTLINHFASSSQAQPRRRLGVVVSAPVEYDSRDFVLHLHAELCKEVIGKNADEEIRKLGRADHERDRAARAARMRAGLALVAGGAYAGAAGLLAVAVSRRRSWVWHPIPDLAALLLVVIALVLIAATPLLPRLKSRTWPYTVLSAGTVSALMFLMIGGGWNGSMLALIGALALLIGCRVAWWQLRRSQPASSTSQADAPENDQLREVAIDHLMRIRYQQSFSHELSMAVKVGGSSPIGMDAGSKRGTTLQERPKTYPDLVDDLHSFLITAADTRTPVIGVDELDKLRSPEAVANFLNDIKSIFGAPGCFYLVSVSEDAAASFERRGMPFREVFDSSFDEVISIEHLDLTAARKVLYGVLLGWKRPFVWLCYVMSGGLARDLRRSARELLNYRNAGDEIELSTAALGMCRRECAARLHAVRHELMRDSSSPASVQLLQCIADITPYSATAATMHAWHRQLTEWAPPVQPRAEQAADPTACRLAQELAAFMIFAGTVLDFFDPQAIGTRLHGAEKPATSPQSLEILAAARKTLAANPGISLAATQSFRKAWNLVLP